MRESTSGIDTICRDAQENVEPSIILDEEGSLNGDEESGDEYSAYTDSVNAEGEYTAPSTPETIATEGEWDQHLSQWQNEWKSHDTFVPSGDSMVFETTEIDALPPPRVVEYVEKSALQLHNFYNYVRVGIENSCREYAQATYGEKLTDVNWLRTTLDRGADKDERFKMADKEWNVHDQTELTDWTYFYKMVGLPKGNEQIRLRLFAAVDKLRHRAVHRRHWELNKQNLELAMILPAILGDYRTASEIHHVYEAFLEDFSTRDAESTAFLNHCLHKEDGEPISLPEMLSRIQSLVEVSAFSYAKEVDSAFLEEFSFEVPEEVELQLYWFRWKECPSAVRQHPNSLVVYPDPEGRGSRFHTILVDMRDLRDNATHRLFNTNPKRSTAYEIRKLVESAITFAIMLGDPATAEKIELIGSTWLAKHRPTVSAV